MAIFNPLDHPICFSHPLWMEPGSSVAHLAFAMTVVDLVAPRLIVDCGAVDGIFYSALCQAVRELQLDTHCYGLTADPADQLSFKDDSAALSAWQEQHDLFYGGFSLLLASISDCPVDLTKADEIDLLHLADDGSDGTARSQFEFWLPGLSAKGVVLISNSNLHRGDFENWKLWREIKDEYPTLEMGDRNRLLVVGVGTSLTEQFRQLVEAREPNRSVIREFFNQRDRHLSRLKNGANGRSINLNIDDHASTLLPAALEMRNRELEALSTDFQAMQGKLERTERALERTEGTLEKTERSLDETEHELEATAAELTLNTTQLTAIINSRAWRWVTHYGRTKNALLGPIGRALNIDLTDSEPHAQRPRIYEEWVRNYDVLTDEDRQRITKRIDQLHHKPQISLVMPVYNVPKKWLRRAIDSVHKQLYPHWELCIADDHSSKPYIRKVLNEYSEADSRIKVIFREETGHISAASNDALKLASGEFVGFLDHDDELAEHALFAVAAELDRHPETDLLYSDEDKIDTRGKRYDPNFKTDWNRDLFYSMNFVSHLSVYRTSLLKEIGGFRVGYEGSQDYDLTLRVIERIPEERIRHIPHILYHWRAVSGSTALGRNEKSYAHRAAREALRSHFERLEKAVTIKPGYHNYHRVSYPLPAQPPLVSLIVATRDRVDLLRQVCTGILEQTDYEPIELIILNNQSSEPETLSYLNEIQQDPRVRVIDYDAPFNFSAINNLGVSEAKGEIIGLINNDIKIVSTEWLREMVSHALRPEIGAVGAKLYYADDTLQHAGVIVGLGGVAGHAHKHLPRSAPGYNCRPHVIQNFSAVTAACLVMRRELFLEIGGLNETSLAIAFNDVEFCLRLRQQGYRILWTPYAEMYHLESASRGSDDVPERRIRFRRESNFIKTEWAEQLASDPYYSPNLTLDREDFSLAFPPRVPKPWKLQPEESLSQADESA